MTDYPACSALGSQQEAVDQFAALVLPICLDGFNLLGGQSPFHLACPGIPANADRVPIQCAGAGGHEGFEGVQRAVAAEHRLRTGWAVADGNLHDQLISV